MKNLRKHIHGITGAVLFLFCGFGILFLTGFTVKLPIPVEEVILIDFTNTESSTRNSDLAECRVQESNENGSSFNKILVQNFEISESIEADLIELAPNTNKIDKLFTNPFANGDDKKDNNSFKGDSKNGPDEIVGKLADRKRIKFVEPQTQENLFGRVVLQITVNEKGNVVEMKLLDTNCNECVQPAKDAVKKWQYEASPDSGLQIGTVIINFKQN
ncbi:MAG TPA: energy transducer TonB [Bacteroidales bacterium]|nr:energy transducer TonB [Bacteroidales bacterium]